jgi:hypothetical protein
MRTSWLLKKNPVSVIFFCELSTFICCSWFVESPKHQYFLHSVNLLLLIWYHIAGKIATFTKSWILLILLEGASMIHCQPRHQTVIGLPVGLNLTVRVFSSKHLTRSCWAAIQVVRPTVRLVGNVVVHSRVPTTPPVPVVLHLHPELILELGQISTVVEIAGAWTGDWCDKVGEQWVPLVDWLCRLFRAINGRAKWASWRSAAATATAPRPWQWAASRRGGVECLVLPQLGRHASPNLITHHWPLARPVPDTNIAMFLYFVKTWTEF